MRLTQNEGVPIQTVFMAVGLFIGNPINTWISPNSGDGTVRDGNAAMTLIILINQMITS